MKPEPYNEYPCPVCEEDVRVSLPLAKYAQCPSCKTKLEINVDAEFVDSHWRDLTTLSVVDPDREHMERMLNHAKKKQLNPQELADAIKTAKAKHPEDYPP